MANTKSDKAILYSYWRSSCSWRVRTVLNYKEIDHELIPITLLSQERFTEEYSKVHPLCQVPALVIDGDTFVESLSIINYLEETRPEKPLLPSTPAGKAKVRAICEMIASGIQPFQNSGVVMDKIDELKTGRREEWCRFFINRGFKALEAVLQPIVGKYCFGDQITLADVCLIPQVFNAHRYKVDLAPYPTIVRIAKALETHPAFVKGHPHNQPDYDPNE